MANAKVCDKCTNLIPGKVYGGNRSFQSSLAANGLPSVSVDLKVGYPGEGNQPDLCGSCFREIVMKAVRDPEPSTSIGLCQICHKPVELPSMTVCVACSDAE